jgi:hemerythrin-like domain-containing protein
VPSSSTRPIRSASDQVHTGLAVGNKVIDDAAE